MEDKLSREFKEVNMVNYVCNDFEKKNLTNQKDINTALEFEMTNCSFCYDRCGICRYYSTLNLSGYCDYHRRVVSSSDPACAHYD